MARINAVVGIMIGVLILVREHGAALVGGVFLLGWGVFWLIEATKPRDDR